MKPVNIGICGLGTVGSGVYNILQRNAKQINSRANAAICVTHVGSRRDNPACDIGETRVSRDIFEVGKDAAVDIVV